MNQTMLPSFEGGFDDDWNNCVLQCSIFDLLLVDEWMGFQPVLFQLFKCMISVQNAHTHTHTYMHAHMHTCMHAHTHARTHTHTHTHTEAIHTEETHTRTHARSHTHTDIHTHVWMVSSAQGDNKRLLFLFSKGTMSHWHPMKEQSLFSSTELLMQGSKRRNHQVRLFSQLGVVHNYRHLWKRTQRTLGGRGSGTTVRFPPRKSTFNFNYWQCIIKYATCLESGQYHQYAYICRSFMYNITFEALFLASKCTQSDFFFYANSGAYNESSLRRHLHYTTVKYSQQMIYKLNNLIT